MLSASSRCAGRNPTNQSEGTVHSEAVTGCAHYLQAASASSPCRVLLKHRMKQELGNPEGGSRPLDFLPSVSLRPFYLHVLTEHPTLKTVEQNTVVPFRLLSHREMGEEAVMTQSWESELCLIC